MKIRTDLRSREIDFDSAPESDLAPIHEALRPLQLRAARTMVAMREKGRHSARACGNVEELATRFGFSVEEARSLYRVGRGLKAFPELESSFLDGRVTYTALERLGRVHLTDDLFLELRADSGFPEGSRAHAMHHERRSVWLKKACTLTAIGFRRHLTRQKAERENREPLIEVREWLPITVDEELARCRILASRKAGRNLTRAETIGETAAHYLDTFDHKLPETCGDNRCDGTCDVCGIDESTMLFDARRRRLPTRVMRLVRHRAGDRCEFPGCTNDVFLEFAHLIPHRQRGDRSPLNTGLLCTESHFQLDSGLVRFLGFGPEGLVFEDRDGNRHGGRIRSRLRRPR